MKIGQSAVTGDLSESEAKAASSGPSLRSVILGLFLALTLPVFVGVLAYNYITSQQVGRSASLERIAYHQQNVATSIELLFRQISASVADMASAGTIQQDLFQDLSALDYLSSVTNGSDDILSAYVGLEADGSFLQGRRMKAGQVIHGQPIPEGCVFARRWMEPQSDGSIQETYVFLDKDNQPLGTSVDQTSYDPRKRPWYQVTKTADSLTISDPDLFATLSLVGFTIAAPIRFQQNLGGIVAIDLTLDGLSSYLALRKVSPNSMSFILDDRGVVIANSAEKTVARQVNDRLSLPHISDWEEALAGIVYSRRRIEELGGQSFFVKMDGIDYVASLKPIAASQDKAWKVFVIAPMNDFDASIRANNQRVLVLGLVAVLVQIIVILALSRRLARPLETLVENVDKVKELKRIDSTKLPRTNVKEIRKLSQAIETLDMAIHSFASFVPVGLVRELLSSDQKLEIGGSSRFLTVFFSDIEGFSTLAEEIPSNELVQKISEYLNIATEAVNQELGTIDKFVGDGVMAFWGAPAMLEDHAKRACLAALRIQRDIGELNRQFARPKRGALRVRIGIHCDAVVVGNVGSSERMSYTVLGDGVNVAARLEALNKGYGSNICISHSVYREAGEALCVRPLGDVQVKGRRASITVYELLGAYGSDAAFVPSPQTEALARLSTAAYRKRVKNDLQGAIQAYREILEAYPNDSLAQNALRDLEDGLDLEPESSKPENTGPENTGPAVIEEEA